MGNCSDRLDLFKREGPPGLEFLCAVHSHLAEPIDMGSVGDGRRMIVPVEPDGWIEGSGMCGHMLSSSTLILLVRSDGIVKVDGQILVEMDDGPVIRFQIWGIRRISAEAAQALGEGQPYDPALLYSRAAILFEAADDGPYAWLNRDLYISKSTRTVRGVESTIWRIL